MSETFHSKSANGAGLAAPSCCASERNPREQTVPKNEARSAGHPQRFFWPGRNLVWFSCGAASAVAAKLAVEKYGANGCEILYCDLANEHPDNDRFLADVEKWLGVTVKRLRSDEFPSMDIYDVFAKHGYIAGIGGARCTRALKREIRMAYAADEDNHIFGFTSDEAGRIADFEKNNPALYCEWLLASEGITKKDCYRIVQAAGIRLPAMYLLGFKNNNCICCVKGGAGYHNKCRRHFPEEWARMARVSREMGVKLVKHKGERIFLDELPPDAGNYQDEPDFECGPQCVMPSNREEVFDGKLPVAGRVGSAERRAGHRDASSDHGGASGHNALVSDPEPVCTASKDANPKGSLEQPVVLGMGSKTILPEGH